MAERITQDATGRAEIENGDVSEVGRPRYNVYFDAADAWDDDLIILCNDCSDRTHLFLVENMAEHDAWHEENG